MHGKRRRSEIEHEMLLPNEIVHALYERSASVGGPWNLLAGLDHGVSELEYFV